MYHAQTSHRTLQMLTIIAFRILLGTCQVSRAVTRTFLSWWNWWRTRCLMVIRRTCMGFLQTEKRNILKYSIFDFLSKLIIIIIIWIVSPLCCRVLPRTCKGFLRRRTQEPISLLQFLFSKVITWIFSVMEPKHSAAVFYEEPLRVLLLYGST